MDLDRYVADLRAQLAAAASAGDRPRRHGWLALGWCVVMTAAGYAWARALYLRKSVR